MRRLLSAIRLAFLSVSALCLSSCYVTLQGSRYLYLRSKAIQADKVLADPTAPESSKDLLRRAQTIRRFAVDALGLKDTKNYKSLVEMESDRLATIVSACDAASFDRYLWRYPVVGALPYKGFFKPEEAEQEATRLKAKGLDVIVRPVDAFSTLGWFSDPLFSFLAKYTDAQLAETIIHELAHATVFVKKDEQFNEEFATFVGRQGALTYIKTVYGEDSPELAEMLNSRRDSDTFAEYLRGTASLLELVYSSDLDRAQKLERKTEIISARALEYRSDTAPRFSEKAYKDFLMEKIDNAYLDLYRLYEGEPVLYRDYFKEVCGSDLKTFVHKIADLAGEGPPLKERMREALAQGAGNRP